MQPANNRKKLLASVALVMCVIVTIVSVALVQLHRQELKVAEQRSISQETAMALRALTASDGLFNLPELGDSNTLESRIDATFMVSEMARESRYAVATEETNASLFSYAEDEQNPLASRLKAYSALRNLKDERWEEWVGLAKEVKDSLPSSVSESDAADYLSIAEPLVWLDDNFKPRTQLVLFDPSVSEQSERLATTTIILDYLFTNSNEIREHFKSLQPKLCEWAYGDASYVQQTLLAANALVGTNKSTCINNDYIAGLYGCKDSSQLVSIDGKAPSVCSLVLTYFTYRLGVKK